MVKDVEECVLGFGYSGEFLNIINNQNVYGLIKTNEIIEMIGTNSQCIAPETDVLIRTILFFQDIIP